LLRRVVYKWLLTRYTLYLHNLTPYELLPQERRTTMEALWEAYRWEGRDP